MRERFKLPQIQQQLQLLPEQQQHQLQQQKQQVDLNHLPPVFVLLFCEQLLKRQVCKGKTFSFMLKQIMEIHLCRYITLITRTRSFRW